MDELTGNDIAIEMLKAIAPTALVGVVILGVIWIAVGFLLIRTMRRYRSNRSTDTGPR